MEWQQGDILKETWDGSSGKAYILVLERIAVENTFEDFNYLVYDIGEGTEKHLARLKNTPSITYTLLFRKE